MTTSYQEKKKMPELEKVIEDKLMYGKEDAYGKNREFTGKD